MHALTIRFLHNDDTEAPKVIDFTHLMFLRGMTPANLGTV